MASIEEYAEHLSVKSNLGRIISDESILMIACNKEVRECLRQLDILVDDRELDLKKQLVDLYKYFTERTRQCQQKDLTIKEKVKKVKVLESHVRRISTEKMETDEIYERNLFGFNSKVATLQNELDRLTKEKEHEEGKNVISVSNLRSNVQSLYNQINWLVSEKEKIDEMNVTQMSELHSQIATIQLKIELAVSEEQQAAERFKTQVSLFKTKFRQLNAMYEQLRYIFKQELHQTNEAVLNADTRMAERKRQIQDLSEKLEACNNGLKTFQENEFAVEGQFNLLKAECKELQNTQASLVTTEQKLKQRIHECEQAEDKAEMEIFKLKCSENNYTEKLELFQQQTINLQNQITDYKHKIQVKESVIEPLLRQLERHRKFGLDEMQDTREKINALQSKNNQLVQDLAKHEDKTNEYLELENQIKEIQKEQRTLTQKQSSYKEDWEKQNKKMQIELDDFRNNMIRDLKNVWKQKEREYKEKIAELESNLKKEREISREYISRFDNNIGSIRCLHENLKDQIQAFL